MATFGGYATTPQSADLTPIPTKALASQVFSPVGPLAVFDFQSPRPYPFGLEETGWGVQDTDKATQIANADGASTLLAPFDDQIGRDGTVQSSGGFITEIHDGTFR